MTLATAMPSNKKSFLELKMLFLLKLGAIFHVIECFCFFVVHFYSSQRDTNDARVVQSGAVSVESFGALAALYECSR
jgi:hypothetical protein